MKTVFLTRQAQLRALFERYDVNAMLLFGYENIRYISGFSGHAAYALITNNEAFLITDYRYAEQAQSETFGFEVICRDRDNETLGHCINRFLPSNCQLGFESDFVSVGMWQAIFNELTKARTAPVQGVVESLRRVKDEWEIKQIQLAASIADQALAETMPYFKAGVTERDIALELEYRMQKLGSQGFAFDTISLFAERTSLPHGVPSSQQLKPGDFITLDFGAVINGYRSDMTRSYVYGEATKTQQEIYSAVVNAQEAAMGQVKAGAPAVNALNASHQQLNNAGFGEHAGEGLGHGVGLFLHEFPIIKPDCEYCLEAGNVITIEPGIYIPNYGGVRLEEDIVVTEQGYQLLTHAPKPFILPE